MAIAAENLIRTLVSKKSNLVSYISFMVGGIESAEDVFQNISIAAYQKRETIQDEGHLMAWLRIAARNESLKIIRNQARKPLQFNTEIVEQLEPHWQQFDQQQFNLHDRLQKCLGELSPKAKSIVKLKYYEGLRGEVIAETLNMKLNTVYVGLSRIHRRLAACMHGKPH